MWKYQKMLQYPVNIKTPSAANAKIVLAQLGGPDGEMGAAARYLNQRYVMPYSETKGMLTDIGTEELGHEEMISTLVYQLTRGLTPQQIKDGGFSAYFLDHTTGIYPAGANGEPFTAAAIQSTGDTISDLFEDMAAEQKARTTYDNILRLVDDADVRDVIKFLREREIVHFQRFGEANRTRWNRTSRKRVTDKIKLRADFFISTRSFLFHVVVKDISINRLNFKGFFHADCKIVLNH